MVEAKTPEFARKGEGLRALMLAWCHSCAGHVLVRRELPGERGDRCLPDSQMTAPAPRPGVDHSYISYDGPSHEDAHEMCIDGVLDTS